MRTLLLSSLLVLTACCTSKEAPVTTKQSLAADTTKVGTPTTLDSKVEGGTARLSLKFDGAGKDVAVTVNGIDGVNVTSARELLSGEKVAAGDERRFDVTFDAGAGRGHLVVTVSGDFGSGVRSRVHSVAVGEGLKKDLGTVQQTSDGDTVKLVP